MMATLLEDNFDHVTQWLMAGLCFGAAGYWWWSLRITVRLAVPWTVTVTAGLLASAVWTGFAFVAIGLDSDHSLPTGLWLRPSVAVYLVLSCARSWLFQPLIRRVMDLATMVRTEIEEAANE